MVTRYYFFRLNPFDEINLNYDANGKLCKTPTTNISEKVCQDNDIKYKVKQQVFVDHCIMDTTDAALNSQLETKNSQDIFVNKGNTFRTGHTVFYNYEHPKKRAPSNFALQAC